MTVLLFLMAWCLAFAYKDILFYFFIEQSIGNPMLRHLSATDPSPRKISRQKEKNDVC